MATLSALTVAAGVSVFAYRTAHTYIGDGPVPWFGVLWSGLLALSLPIAASVYRAMMFSRRTFVPVGIVSMLAAGATALMRPGNMFLIGYLWVFSGAVTAILVSKIVVGRMANRQRADP